MPLPSLATAAPERYITAPCWHQWSHRSPGKASNQPPNYTPSVGLTAPQFIPLWLCTDAVPALSCPCLPPRAGG